METLWQDVVCRSNDAQNLGFTTAAVLCLMLGIGARPGFSRRECRTLAPLPYAHPSSSLNLHGISTFRMADCNRFWIPGRNFWIFEGYPFWASLDMWITRSKPGGKNATRARHGCLRERRTPGNACRGESKDA